MMNVEHRKGKDVPVIKKALTELDGELFQLFKAERERWATEDCFKCIGPIQFEYKALYPYLVKAPAKDKLYSDEKYEPDPKCKPYSVVDPKYNMSYLAFARAKDLTPLPKVF